MCSGEPGDIPGKMVFLEQRARGTILVWAAPFMNLRVPQISNLRTDPHERDDITSNTDCDWLLDHVFCSFRPGTTWASS
jgi:arylsulfatase